MFESNKNDSSKNASNMTFNSTPTGIISDPFGDYSFFSLSMAIWALTPGVYTGLAFPIICNSEILNFPNKKDQED